MGEIITIGLDLAKSVFQVHAVDEAGKVVVRRQVKRAQLLAFFAALTPVWSAWRPVRARISGRGNWASSGTRRA